VTLTDLGSETLHSLLSNKVRSSLTILGIVVGIASVILMVSIGQGSTASITSAINSAGANLLIVRPGGEGQGGPPGFSQQRNAGASLTPADAEAIAALPNVAHVAPVSSSQYTVSAGAYSSDASVLGVTSDYAAVRSIETSSGSFVSDSDVQQITKVAVLGSSTAADLFGDGVDPTGKTVRINGINFTVIGWAKSKGSSGFNNQDAVAYIPLSTMQRYLTGSEDYDNIYVEAASSDVMDGVQSGIESALMVTHKITDPTALDFQVQNQADILSTASTITGTLTALLASIAGISLVVGGIGIMNMMLTTVTERTREIGLRKAIGARRGDVTSQFLAEAITLCLIGGLIGILIGWGGAAILNATGLLTAVMSWTSAGLAVAVCATIGVVFGYYPARRAAKLDPIEALRYQ
jgi:putative ABC transport system permease protein